jgi:hypothetical protein
VCDFPQFFQKYLGIDISGYVYFIPHPSQLSTFHPVISQDSTALCLGTSLTLWYSLVSLLPSTHSVMLGKPMSMEVSPRTCNILGVHLNPTSFAGYTGHSVAAAMG